MPSETLTVIVQPDTCKDITETNVTKSNSENVLTYTFVTHEVSVPYGAGQTESRKKMS